MNLNKSILKGVIWTSFQKRDADVISLQFFLDDERGCDDEDFISSLLQVAVEQQNVDLVDLLSDHCRVNPIHLSYAKERKLDIILSILLSKTKSELVKEAFQPS